MGTSSFFSAFKTGLTLCPHRTLLCPTSMLTAYVYKALSTGLLTSSLCKTLKYRPIYLTWLNLLVSRRQLGRVMLLERGLSMEWMFLHASSEDEEFANGHQGTVEVPAVPSAQEASCAQEFETSLGILRFPSQGKIKIKTNKVSKTSKKLTAFCSL